MGKAVLQAGPARLTEGSESPALSMGLGLTGRSRTRASHCPLARGVVGADLAFRLRAFTCGNLWEFRRSAPNRFSFPFECA
jgi:hypothetical protein